MWANPRETIAQCAVPFVGRGAAGRSSATSSAMPDAVELGQHGPVLGVPAGPGWACGGLVGFRRRATSVPARCERSGISSMKPYFSSWRR